MPNLTEKAYEQALDLPLDSRIALIDKLLMNTNLPTRANIDQAWLKEIESRFQQFERGQIKFLSGKDCLKRSGEGLQGEIHLNNFFYVSILYLIYYLHYLPQKSLLKNVVNNKELA